MKSAPNFRRLVLGCIDTSYYSESTRTFQIFEMIIYKIRAPLHGSDLKEISASFAARSDLKITAKIHRENLAVSIEFFEEFNESSIF